MPDSLPPPTFEINKADPQGKAIARLPTLGTRNTGNILDAPFRVTNLDTYHAALHAAFNDINTASNGIIEAAKALGATPPQAMSYSMLSYMPDPANSGLMQWPGMQPESLRKVARENIMPQMVIRSRVADMRRYSCLSTHPWSPGWKIELRDASSTPSEQDKKDIKEAERFIWNCSREQAYSDPRDRDAHHISQFENFLVSGIDDSLTFDGWAIWTDRDRAGRIRSFANLPAGMIRLALPGKGYKNRPDVFAALVDDTGTVAASFTRDEMVWCVRNVRTDPNIIGYGWSEIEIAIMIIQAFGAAVELNTATFTKNGIPNGMLLLKGDFWQQDQIDALQREWINMKRGVSKMWGVPIIAVPEEGDVTLLNFMELKGQEIRYKDHLNLMAGVYCIISQYPVKRMGLFASGNHRDNQPSPDESTEIAGIDDPGLPAMLTFIEHRVNEYLLQPNWPRLQLGFQAKNSKEDARSYEFKKNASIYREIRAAADLPALTKDVPGWLKPVMEAMELAPEDPAKLGAYTSLAIEALKEKLGVNDKPEGAGAGGSTAKPAGAPFPSKKDPAQSQAHGHRAGVRRSPSSNEQNT